MYGYHPQQKGQDSLKSHIRDILPGKPFGHVPCLLKKTAMANEHHKLCCCHATCEKVGENHKFPSKMRHRK